MRKIKLANAQKRDAEVAYGGLVHKSNIYFQLPDKRAYENEKILKLDIDHSYETLLARFGTDEDLAQALLAGDPEIDLYRTGKIINQTQKILVNEQNQPIYRVQIKEIIHQSDGTVKEERDFAERQQNIVSDYPVSWTGKQIPIADAYNKFIFSKKYQLSHTNGLTFDFLFNMAQELFEKKVLMLMAGGPKGNEPLVFNENGRPYRAFLEGRIKGDDYLLLMHISNLELKSIL